MCERQLGSGGEWHAALSRRRHHKEHAAAMAGPLDPEIAIGAQNARRWPAMKFCPQKALRNCALPGTMRVEKKPRSTAVPRPEPRRSWWTLGQQLINQWSEDNVQRVSSARV
jgi:hypothetical protein